MIHRLWRFWIFNILRSNSADVWFAGYCFEFAEILVEHSYWYKAHLNPSKLWPSVYNTKHVADTNIFLTKRVDLDIVFKRNIRPILILGIAVFKWLPVVNNKHGHTCIRTYTQRHTHTREEFDIINWACCFACNLHMFAFFSHRQL